MAVKLIRFGVRRYGPFDELEVELGDVTIFVGRNNTGKSTALEAIALLLSATNKFRDVYGRNLARRIVATRGNYLYKDGKGPEAQVWGNIGVQLKLNIVKGVENLEGKCRDAFLQYIDSVRAEEEATQIDANVVDELIHTLVKKLFYMCLYVEGSPAYLAFMESRGMPLAMAERNLRLLPILLKLYAGELAVQPAEVPVVKVGYERAEDPFERLKPRDKARLVAMLRRVVPYFCDYRDGHVLLFDCTKSVPAWLLGDGFKALVSMLAHVVVGTDVIVVDEPERHMHPGFMEKFVKHIVTYSTHGMQFIAATHSSEFLDNLLEEAQKRDVLDGLRIVRLYLLQRGEIDYEVLTGSEAYEERKEIAADLRGP
ncbi:MAG: AAA family ATPase [Pyrobaculum sp.]